MDACAHDYSKYFKFNQKILYQRTLDALPLLQTLKTVNLKRRHGDGFNKHNKFILNEKQRMLGIQLNIG